MVKIFPQIPLFAINDTGKKLLTGQAYRICRISTGIVIKG
jgi:hypothetical protein